MADLLTQSWVKSFSGPPTAIARAGNVIGGGDVSPDRLLPDLIASHQRGARPQLRYPGAVRPWQHVLDCLNGYLTLVDALLQGRGLGEWNFGPEVDSFVSVGEVADLVATSFGAPTGYSLAERQPHEAGLLALDSRKAQVELGWRNLLSFEPALEWTLEWEAAVDEQMPADRISLQQLQRYWSMSETAGRLASGRVTRNVQARLTK